mgnify:CR=1 FL=1
MSLLSVGEGEGGCKSYTYVIKRNFEETTKKQISAPLSEGLKLRRGRHCFEIPLRGAEILRDLCCSRTQKVTISYPIRRSGNLLRFSLFRCFFEIFFSTKKKFETYFVEEFRLSLEQEGMIEWTDWTGHELKDSVIIH